VQVVDDRVAVVGEPDPRAVQPIPQLDILVGGGGEPLVEATDREEIVAPGRDVGRVEAAEGRVVRVGDLPEVEAVTGREASP
jgi:hypothetical protein